MISTSYNNLFAIILTASGLGLIGWTVWGYTDRNYPELAGYVAEPAVPATGGIPNNSASYNIQSIVSNHLFGSAKVKVAANIQQAPQTRLRLNLLGVLASSNIAYARALIRVESKTVKTYGVGESIEGTDAILHSVEGDKVILDRHGKYESLAMVRKKLAWPGSKGNSILKTKQSVDANLISEPSAFPF